MGEGVSFSFEGDVYNFRIKGVTKLSFYKAVLGLKKNFFNINDRMKFDPGCSSCFEEGT